MKKIIIIILCVSICLFSTGCQTNKKKFDIEENEIYQSYHIAVEFEIK